MTKVVNVVQGSANVVEVDSDSPAASVSSGAGPLETLILATGENIVLGTVVVLVGGVAYRFDVNNANHTYAFVGIALTSATSGQIVVVQPSGIVTIAGWNLTPGAVYHVGTNGALTTTPNLTAGHILQTLGRATSTNTLLLRPDDPITL